MAVAVADNVLCFAPMIRNSKKKLPKLETFGLTPKEMQIAPLIARGKSHKLIAERIKISRHTVEVHLKNIRRKIGTDTTPEAGYFLSHYFA